MENLKLICKPEKS